MSQRSVVEFNHDYAHTIDAKSGDELVVLLVRALSSGSDQAWEPLWKFGIRRIVQLHHSDDRQVVTKYAEYPFG